MGKAEQEWLEAFVRFWSDPLTNFELLRRLFAENIKLIGPGLPTVRGLRRALMFFEQTFRQMPDLRATIERSAYQEGILFIEMTFSATIAGEVFTWPNVDRFLLTNGRAQERRAFFDPTELRSRIAGINVK